MPSQFDRRNIIPVFALTALIIMGLMLLMTAQVMAQGGSDPQSTPDPDFWYVGTPGEWNFPYFQPGTSSGDAEWTLEAPNFVSMYPGGFQFEVFAHSSAGQIIDASVIWSHTPNQLRRREAEINPVTGQISLHWIPNESLPPWVAVNYYWSFTDSEGNRYRSDWILGSEYEDNLAEWERFENEDVIVFIQDGLPIQTAELTLQAMADQHETFLQAWGGPLSYKPRVVLFADRQDFARWRRGFGGSSIVGQTSDIWGATVQVIVEGDITNLIYGTVLHEIGHLYQFEYAADAFPAGTWFTEGDATFFELSQEYDYEGRIRDFADDNILPILLEGDGPFAFENGPDSRGRYGYDVGYTFFRWLVLNYGLDAHRQLVEGLGEGRDRNTLLTEITGLSVRDIETAWREWLGAQGPPATLIPTPTIEYRFPPTVTPYQFPTSTFN